MAKLLKLQEEMEPEFWTYLPVVGSLEEGAHLLLTRTWLQS